MRHVVLHLKYTKSAGKIGLLFIVKVTPRRKVAKSQWMKEE